MEGIQVAAADLRLYTLAFSDCCVRVSLCEQPYLGGPSG